MSKLLKSKYQELVKEYTDAFCEKMYGEPTCDIDFWVGGDVGGVICIGDDYWSFDTIRKTVDNSYDPKQVFAWYDYCVEIGEISHDIKTPNLDNWIGGCPRLSEGELENLRKLNDKVREAHENLQIAVEELKNLNKKGN